LGLLNLRKADAASAAVHRQSVLTPVNAGVADGRAELPSLFPAEIIADG
jgi:hypothetical protein